MKKPLILITNDDGWQAAGIKALVRTISPIAELYIVAPDGPRSGVACAITSIAPVNYRELSCPDVHTHWYACSGTPVDCVKLALHSIVPRKPDLLLSGINAGDNASISVHYSGTMGAVLEGCIKGIPSIGLSLFLKRGQRYEEHPVGEDTLQAITTLCQNVLQTGLPADVCLNINIPTDKPFQGWRTARQARGQWNAEWEERHDSSESNYTHSFRLTGEFTDLEPNATDTDFAAIRAGFCSVVPVTIDTTAHKAIAFTRQLTDN